MAKKLEFVNQLLFVTICMGVLGCGTPTNQQVEKRYVPPLFISCADEIRQLSSEIEDRRLSAARRLEACPASVAVPALVSHIDVETDNTVVNRTLFSLSKFEKNDPELNRLLRSEDNVLRELAASALHPNDAPRYEWLLKDPDLKVRLAIAEKLASKRGWSILRRAILAEPDSYVRARMIEYSKMEMRRQPRRTMRAVLDEDFRFHGLVRK